MDASLHSPILTSLHLRQSSFSNPSAALPTSQLILQTFLCFTYVIGTSPTSPGEPPMPLWWCLIAYIHDDFVICNDCGPQDYLKDVNWPWTQKIENTWPTSQLILQPFFLFSYVTSSSLNSPGETPMSLPRQNIFLSRIYSRFINMAYHHKHTHSLT